MGELGKVVRWSAPGSVCILLASVFAALNHSIVGQEWLLGGDSGSRLDPWPELTGGLVAVLVAASVPLGFLLYQIYYVAYSRPHGFVFSFVHMDVAWQVNKGLARPLKGLESNPEWRVKNARGLFVRWPRHMRVPFSGWVNRTLWLYESAEDDDSQESAIHGATPEALATEEPLSPRYWRSRGFPRQRSVELYHEALEEYARRRENNWLLLESQMHERLRSRSDSEREFRETERLADIFHTLGATKTAVAFGWAIGNAATLWPLFHSHGNEGIGRFLAVWLLGVAVSAAPAAWLYRVLHENRGHCARRRVEMMNGALQVLEGEEPVP